jgi:hypothetical protein
MKGIGITRMVSELHFELIADFTFQTSHVHTITSEEFSKLFPHYDSFPEIANGIEIPIQKEVKSQFGYLLIDSTFELEAYDSLNEGSAKIRPQLLVIHGILSFLTTKYLFLSKVLEHFNLWLGSILLLPTKLIYYQQKV